MKMELRVNPTSIEVNDDGDMVVSGYVNKTEQYSNLLGHSQKFKEVIKRGAWQRAIDAAKEIHFLAEHDNKKILASTRNGSLKLTEDENGLFMSATISPTSWGKDYYQLIKDGILSNMSFGFRAVKDAWRNMGSHFERVVNELELFEVSVVRDPAYSQSTISARGIDLVEDVEIPSVTNFDITIRSEEDLKVLADELFKKLYEQLKAAASQDVEVVDEVEGDGEEKTEDTDVVIDVGAEEQSPETTEVVNEVIEDEVVEESKEVEDTDVVDEQTEVVEDQPTDAEKIRDFVNKFKN